MKKLFFLLCILFFLPDVSAQRIQSVSLSANLGNTPDSYTDTSLREVVEWKVIDGVKMPVPPKVHPRLYLRKQHIASLS